MTRLRLAPATLRLEPVRGRFALDRLARESAGSGVALMASNENPFGPSRRAVLAARRAAGAAHRYPDPASSALRNKLAGDLALPPEAILVGNGSSALIELLARSFLDDGASAVVSEGSFVVYRMAIAAAGGTCRQAPMTGRRGHDLRAMAALIDSSTRLVFIANPNNPTGTYVGAAELEAFLSIVPGDVLVVVDEAYRDYVVADDYPDCAARAGGGAPVAVLRTFSKIHGLAGLRLGYAVMPPDLAERLDAARPPYGISSVAEAAGIAALDDIRHQEQSRERNLAGLSVLSRGLSRLGIESTPSVGNFVMFEAPMGAGALARGLLESGILVRPMDAFGFPGAVRVSVGTETQNRRFLGALSRILRKAP